MYSIYRGRIPVINRMTNFCVESSAVPYLQYRHFELLKLLRLLNNFVWLFTIFSFVYTPQLPETSLMTLVFCPLSFNIFSNSTFFCFFLFFLCAIILIPLLFGYRLVTKVGVEFYHHNYSNSLLLLREKEQLIFLLYYNILCALTLFPEKRVQKLLQTLRWSMCRL